MKPTYKIILASTLPDLQAKVIEAIAEGYAPVGGVFNASIFSPPYPTIAQPMVLETPKKS